MATRRHLRWLVFAPFAVALAIACGEDLPGETAPIKEAGADVTIDAATDSPADAVVDAGPKRCDLDDPFGTPVPVLAKPPTVSGGGIENDRTPHLTEDERTIVFASQRGANRGWRFYIADRESTAVDFPEPTILPLPVPGDLDLDPMISPDGLTLYFQSIRLDAGGQDEDIYFATRSQRSGPFTGIQMLPISAGPNSASSDFQPFATPTGLWLTSKRTGDIRIWFAPGTGGAFGTASLVELGPTLTDGTPTPTFDGRALYFTAVHTGDDVDGGSKANIWLARREGTSGPFDAGTLKRIDELKTAENDSPGWISPDNCRLYFDREQVVDAARLGSLYVASRTPK